MKSYDAANNFLFPIDLALPRCTPFNCRIKLVVFFNSTFVTVNGGVQLRNSPFWTLQFGLCSCVVVENVSIIGDRRWPNGDGIDVVSSTNVRIINNTIDTGDDCIDLSTHIAQMPTRNVTVQQNRLSSTSCTQNIGMFVVADITDVLWRDNIVRDTNRAIGIMPRIGTGTVSNIRYDNISIETKYFSLPFWGSAEPIYVCGGGLDANVKWTGLISNVTFDDIVAQSANGILLQGFNDTK